MKSFLGFKSIYQKILFLAITVLFSLIFGLHINQDIFCGGPTKTSPNRQT